MSYRSSANPISTFKKNLLLTVFLLFFNVLAVSALADEIVNEEVALLAESAEALRTDDKFTEAETIYKQIIATCPDTEYEFEALRNLSTLYIETGNDAAVETVKAQLLADYSTHPDIASVVWDIGVFYGWEAKWDKAITNHAFNSRTYQKEMYGMWSQIEITKYRIENGDYTAAQSSFDVLVSQFTEQETLPKEIYQLAKKCEQKGRRDKAASMHGYNVTHFSNDLYALWSQVDITCYALRDGDIEIADWNKDKLLTTFASQPTLPKELCIVGSYYKNAGEYGKAIELYKYVMQNWPGDEYALKALEGEARSLIESGAEEAGVSIIQTIKTEYATDAKLGSSLNEIALSYTKVKRYNETIELYNYVINNWPGTPAAMNSLTEMALVNIYIINFKIVEECVERIVVDCISVEGVGRSIFIIGEEYYFIAKQYLKEDNWAQAVFYYQKAFEVWEKNLNEIDDSDHKCLSYYTMGLANRDLGYFFEAVEALQMAYQINPTFQYADFCLFENIRCYGKLAKSGEVTYFEAFYNSCLFLDELLKKFPDSKYISYAQKWLVECPEE